VTRLPAQEDGDGAAAEDDAARLLIVASNARDPDVAPFVGGAHLGECFVLWRRGETPTLAYLTAMERDEAAATGCRLLEPEALEVRRIQREAPDRGAALASLLAGAFERVGWEAGEVAVAGRFPAGDLLEAVRRLEEVGWSFVSGHAQTLRHRKSKGEIELAAARRAARGTISAFRRIAQLLAGAEPVGEEWVLEGEPLTVGRLRSAAARTLAAAGLEQPRGNIFAVGSDAAVPHSAGSDDRRLGSGEALIVDLYPRGGVFADCTRTFCLGSPPPGLLEAHAHVREALERSFQRLAPGLQAWELQVAVCDLFEDAGYRTPRSHPGTEEGYVHNLGHGVGYELHELPSFQIGAGSREGRLGVGDLLTLEPGLYDPAAGWGVRLEDLCYLGPERPENLTPLPYDLDPRTWVG
jgi:Xaa-Pro aminopeptidase